VADGGTRVAVGGTGVAVAVGVADGVYVAVGRAAATDVSSVSTICCASSADRRGASVRSDGTSGGASAERAPLLDVPALVAAVVATTANDQMPAQASIATARTAQPSMPCSRCQNEVVS
jgi:hypothetical protein